MKYFLFLSLTLLFSFKIYAHGTIIISSVENNKGYIDVKIYTDKENFLKEEVLKSIGTTSFFTLIFAL